MNLTRRAFLSGTAALPLVASLPPVTLSRITIGDATLTTVSDGSLTLPGDFFYLSMPQEQLAVILNEMQLSRDEVTRECNLALYRDDARTVLFDVGSGPDFMPTAGKVLETLDAAGVAAEEITHVIFTHAHPDHIWGLLDDFDEPAFPQAAYMMGRDEWDYWWDPETVNTIGEARAAFAVGAKRRMEAIEDSVELFEDGQEILPGIAAVASPGHTPGHMSFEVRNGNNAAMIVGDAIGNHHVAFRRPDWQSGADQDAGLAAKSRRMLLDRITAENLQLVGFHLPGGGIGRSETLDGGFRFVPGDQ